MRFISVVDTLKVAIAAAVLAAPGCNRDELTKTAPPPNTAAAPPPVSEEDVQVAPQSYEFTAGDLLSARLTEQECSEGWVNLFDGHTLFGWEIAGRANFRVEDGTIVVDGGENCLLCTSVPWQDYELTLEFHAGPKTNSGVFLRTPMYPEDPATDCYEVNIAPGDNPFPTAGVVKRQKAESAAEQPFDQWREMTMRLEGNQLQVSVDGEMVCDYSDPIGLPAGRIGLQHNSGRVAFRNIRLRASRACDAAGQRPF